MVDVCHDPRWGRIAEGSGEDAWLGGILAAARTRGFTSALETGRRVAACPKHYVAYGGSEAGRDYNSVDISERTLREVHLPPFKAAFEAGADSVMSSFNEIAGVPATVNAFALKTILRDEWDWPGVVLSDYTAIAELIPHGVARDLEDAARLSILAGVDMDMTSDAYDRHLQALVKSGAVPEATVDASVRRVLRLKLKLGLFERTPINHDLKEREDFQDLALEVARESMVLLKNADGVLPLSPASRVAVIGPLAEARADLLGCWAPMGRADDVETVLEALTTSLKEAPTHEPGCAIQSDDMSGVPAAVKAAQGADVVVVVVGESADMSGEAHSRVHLGLPGRQQDLVDALAATGKPIVCVLMCGRPLVIPRLAHQASALLLAWHGGVRAARAVADLLLGVANPSGRLTTGFPRAEGQIPVYYAHKNTGRPVEGRRTLQFDEAFKSHYLDEPNSPLFPFGFGLSYTTFAYSQLTVETGEGMVVASARIENTGQRAGTEVAQLYVRDLVGSVTRPVRELKAFERISLEPGEARTVSFEVPVERLGFIGLEMRYTVEPGDFRLWIGPDSSSGLEGSFVLSRSPSG
jgi:beta-glucosidase